MTYTKRIAAGFVAWLLTAAPGFAEDAEHAEGAHEKANNSIGVFVGITSEERREKGLAIGIEGGHYFNESFGIAGVLEYTFGDIDTLVGAVPLVFRAGKWKFYGGPGFENRDSTDETEFLVRVGTEYAFEAGSFEIAPQLNLDLVDGDAVFVVGVLFARGF